MSQKSLNASDSWQKTLYGSIFARLNLDSLPRHKTAKKEIEFLIHSLKLQKDQSILDVPCGTGRHTLALAKKGYSVTGIDINDICLKLAQENCQGMKNVKIKKGNMAQLNWAKGKFHTVLNMYTSFGYFRTDRKNKTVLKGLVQALKPGGQIIIQTINRDWLLRVFTPFNWWENSRFLLISKRKFYEKTKYIEAYQAVLCKKSGLWEKSCHRIRLYSIPEMKTLLRETGLKRIRVFKDSSGDRPRRIIPPIPFIPLIFKIP